MSTRLVLAAGDIVAGHRVEALIGRGGTSEVYRAVNLDSGVTVALKILTASEARSEYGRSRFDREFTIAKELRHPDIVAVFDHGEAMSSGDTALPYTTMQYVDGSTAAALAEHAPHRRLAPATVATIVTCIARALDYAHDHEVLHRDVKPSNILVPTAADGERALLTDFGIARVLNDVRPLNRNGRILGSVPYAAPELLQAGHLDPRVDEYALACTFVELITGEPPYPRPTVFGIVSAHISAAPPSVRWRVSEIPHSVDSIVAKALAKDPAQRYGTCGEFATLVTRAMYIDDPATDSPPPRPRHRRRLRRSGS